MFLEVARITVSVVLFIQMGLSEAIQDVIQIRIRFLTCPKCLTWWSCMCYLTITGHPLLVSLATSFIASYCALWLSLLYDSLALLYNYCYEQISKTNDTAEGSEAEDYDLQTESDEVS